MAKKVSFMAKGKKVTFTSSGKKRKKRKGKNRLSKAAIDKGRKALVKSRKTPKQLKAYWKKRGY